MRTFERFTKRGLPFVMLATVLLAGCSQQEVERFLAGLFIVIVMLALFGLVLSVIYFGVLIAGIVRLLQGRPSIALGVSSLVLGGLSILSTALVALQMLTQVTDPAMLDKHALVNGVLGALASLVPAFAHCFVGVKNVIDARARQRPPWAGQYGNPPYPPA